ncbi:2'-5' RNA ligase family protein [Treponema sp.]|uniref:2'-5' RNA ligase family protein n=1 Tax=Treponema sp. TaxID=166 RepID=UPI0025EA2FC0|nr:2'-5' RNA ligase family protein [Treponema sp.]MBR4322005.1 2'-5' RNA ligase family protein [Treponema sp.]
MTKSSRSESRTYSVSLILDNSSAEKILSAQKELARITQNDNLAKNPPPPHITLGFFHAKDEDFPKLKELFEEFSKSSGLAFDIDFGQPDSFLNKVIFLPVKKDSPSLVRLKSLNLALHEKLSVFEAGANRNYLPENFFPHVALAVKLTKNQFEKGMNWAFRLSPSRAHSFSCSFGFSGFRLSATLPTATADAAPTILHAESIKTECAVKKLSAESEATCPDLPASAKIIAISLAETHPYKELSRISLATDTLSLEQRHKNMSAIRSTGGKLEVALRSQLFKFGFRFRKNDKRLTGSPDIVFPHYQAVIFINGCFWHAHGWSPKNKKGKKAQKSEMIKSSLLEENILYSLKCEKFRMPTTNTDFWLQKFTRNRERDIRDIEKLLEEGWRVGVVWECSITGRLRKQKILSTAEKISLWLEEGQSELFKEF